MNLIAGATALIMGMLVSYPHPVVVQPPNTTITAEAVWEKIVENESKIPTSEIPARRKALLGDILNYGYEIIYGVDECSAELKETADLIVREKAERAKQELQTEIEVDFEVIEVIPEVSTTEEVVEQANPQYNVIKDVIIPNYPDYKGFKCYEAHNVFSHSSNQYKLQQLAYTSETGLRMYEDRYIVAIGSGACNKIGQYFDIVLENGTIIPCIMGDMKADIHTDDQNLMSMGAKCVSEFVCEISKLDTKTRRSGNVSNVFPEWNSKVKEIIVYDHNCLQ